MKVIKHSFDGVIVGAGGAGLRAAIEACLLYTSPSPRDY